MIPVQRFKICKKRTDVIETSVQYSIKHQNFHSVGGSCAGSFPARIGRAAPDNGTAAWKKDIKHIVAGGKRSDNI